MIKTLTELIAQLQAIHEEHGEMMVTEMAMTWDRDLVDITSASDAKPRYVDGGRLDVRIRVTLRKTAQI